MNDVDRAIDFIFMVTAAHYDDLVGMEEDGLLDDPEDALGLKADVADYENVLEQLQRLRELED